MNTKFLFLLGSGENCSLNIPTNWAKVQNFTSLDAIVVKNYQLKYCKYKDTLKIVEERNLTTSECNPYVTLLQKFHLHKSQSNVSRFQIKCLQYNFTNQ